MLTRPFWITCYDLQEACATWCMNFVHRTSCMLLVPPRDGNISLQPSL